MALRRATTVPAGRAWSPATCHRRGTVQGLGQTWPFPLRSGQSLVNVNLVGGSTEGGEAMSFSVQVLLIGADRGNPIGSATMAHLLPRGPVRSNA
jgi:hypothetical protein